MRDLRKDIETCNQATPGPWRCLDDTPVDTQWASVYPEDLDFVMGSREGWPHAIERAIKAEVEVERLKAENALLRKVASIAWNVVETRGMSDVLLSELAGRLADWETWKEGEE